MHHIVNYRINLSIHNRSFILTIGHKKIADDFQKETKPDSPKGTNFTFTISNKRSKPQNLTSRGRARIMVSVVISRTTLVPAVSFVLSTLLRQPTTYLGPLLALTITERYQQRK